MIRKYFFVNKQYLKLAKLGLVLAIIVSLSSCKGNSGEDLVGNWVQVSDFGGMPRTSATCTTIDDKVYVGTGYNAGEDKRLNDFWVYNGGSWDEIAKFPGSARTNAVSFAIDGKLYVGTGFDGTSGERLKDFYEYDPQTNTWTSIPDMESDNPNSDPIRGREGMVAFSINGIGYVGLGVDKSGVEYNDFYAYNPSAQSWSKKNDFLGGKRKDAVAFVIDNEAYVCTGTKSGQYVDDFYKYDAANDAWIKLRSISDRSDESYDDDYAIARNNAVAFVSGGKGYVATGGKNSSSMDVWEYDPSTDLWMQKTNFEGAARMNAVAFTRQDVGYVLTGQQGSSSDFDDVWKFEPNAAYDKNY